MMDAATTSLLQNKNHIKVINGLGVSASELQEIKYIFSSICVLLPRGDL